jgi:hypothetical protein
MALLECSSGSFLLGGMLFGRLLLFQLYKIALQAFEITSSCLDKMFGLVGRLEGVEH